MRCNNCGEDNVPGRKTCWKCHRDLSEGLPPGVREGYSIAIAKVGAMIVAASAYLAFQMVAPYIFDTPSDGSVNMVRAICAGVVIVGGWIAGYKFARWLNDRPDK